MRTGKSCRDGRSLYGRHGTRRDTVQDGTGDASTRDMRLFIQGLKLSEMQVDPCVEKASTMKMCAKERIVLKVRRNGL